MRDRLTEITKERYETGAYGNAYLLMSRATVDRFKDQAAPPSLSAVPYFGQAGRLWDIPVVLDASLPLGAWRLIDRTTGEEIESEGVTERGYERAIEVLRAIGDDDWVAWAREYAIKPGRGLTNTMAADYLESVAASPAEGEEK